MEINTMFYYNVVNTDNKIQKIIPISEEEYAKSVNGIVNKADYSFGQPGVSIPVEISYYESGFFLATTDELQLNESNMNYYKVTVTKDAVSVAQVTKKSYDDIALKVDKFNIFVDSVEIKGHSYPAYGFYLTAPTNNRNATTVVDEGFYIALENQELSTFKWIRNFGEVYDN